MNKDERLQKEKTFHNERFSQGGDSRSTMNRYYAIAQSSWDYYRETVQLKCDQKRVLEYGCGTGGSAFRLAESGSLVSGIDISEAAIVQARQIADKNHLDITFRVMNAERLDFPDNSFDVICGSAILHHLDLKKAYSELRRVLSPVGTAIFLEPLGHNPIINCYRKITPKMRTEDEHPLLIKDLTMSKALFQRVELKYFYLTALLAIPFSNSRIFKGMLTFLESVDRVLFALTPFMRRYAWAVVITLSQPRKISPDEIPGK